MKKTLIVSLALLMVSGGLQIMGGYAGEKALIAHKYKNVPFGVNFIIDNQTSKVIELKQFGSFKGEEAMQTSFEPGKKKSIFLLTSQSIEIEDVIHAVLLAGNEKLGSIAVSAPFLVSLNDSLIVASFRLVGKRATRVLDEIKIPRDFNIIRAQVLITLKGDDLSESTLEIKNF